MKKRLQIALAIILCMTLALGLSSCSSSNDDDNSETEFVAATIDVDETIPVSKQEIISFYNNVVSKIQDNSNFTAENRPGVKTDESLKVSNIEILSLNSETGESQQSDSLNALNKSAKAIKDRILSGIDTSIPVVPFGDMNESISSVIYPYNTSEMQISVEDVLKAECNVDSNNLNITLTLADNADSIDKIFGTRDKNELLKSMNENCAEYAEIKDYTQTFVEDDENNVHSVIYLAVEVEKQADKTYKCTGRIMSLDIKIISDIQADVTAKGSFADSGDLKINFRLTDEKYYEFDWLGSSTWEPKAD